MPRVTAVVHCIAPVALAMFIGCGDAADSDSNERTQVELTCENVPPDDCDRTSADDCSPARVALIREEDGCHESSFLNVACQPVAACSAASTIAVDVTTGSPVLFLGCLTPDYDEIVAPTETMVAASRVSCAYLNPQTDEECATYTAEDCPTDLTNCGLSQGFRYDRDNACVDYRVATEPECRAIDVDGNNVLAMDPEGGLWEFRPGTTRPLDWPEVSDPGFADYGRNDSCSD